jgi:hypothetical protein
MMSVLVIDELGRVHWQGAGEPTVTEVRGRRTRLRLRLVRWASSTSPCPEEWLSEGKQQEEEI